MSKTQQWVMGTVVVLLVIVGFVANGLFIKTSGDLKKANEEIASLKSQPTVEPAPDDSPSEKNMLSRVADLLPEGANITHTLALQNGLTLVTTVPNFDGGSEQVSMTLWLVDTANNKITELSERDITGPGVTTSLEDAPYTAIARSRILIQWEGLDDRITDYVATKDGALLLTQYYHSGDSIDLARNGKTLKLELAPKDGCKTNVSEPARHVNVTGILANGVEIKFKKPYGVTCQPSEMEGMGFYPQMPEVQFDGQATAQAENMAYLTLPFGHVSLTIDVDRMTSGGVKISE